MKHSYFSLILLLLSFYSCEWSGKRNLSFEASKKFNNTEAQAADSIVNDTNLYKDECKTIFLDKGSSEYFFRLLKKIEFTKLNSSFHDQLKVSRQSIVNNYDSTLVDTLITLKSNINNFVFLSYTTDTLSNKSSYRLMQIELVNEKLNLLKGHFSIGDDYEKFWKNIIMKNFPKEKKFKSNCICISDLSAYNEFYFNFKNGKLFSFSYYSNAAY